MQTKNFQMYKLNSERVEQPEMKLPIFGGSQKKQENSRKTSTYAKAFDCVDLWKILKEMGIADHLTCLLRNLYAGQEGTVRTKHATTDWFQTEKVVHQRCILSPCLLNLYTEYTVKRWAG